MSYALFPRFRPAGQYLTFPYTTNAFDTPPPMAYDHHCGTIIHPNSSMCNLNELIAKTKNILMPNDLMAKMKDCRTISEFDALLKDNEEVFDTYFYGKEGLVHSDIDCILDLHFPQPYRTAYSCTTGPSICSPPSVPNAGSSIRTEQRDAQLQMLDVVP